MSITREQLLEYYLVNLSSFISDDEEDPTLYNALYHLNKYYNDNDKKVPGKHQIYFLKSSEIILKDDFNDYVTDNGETTFNKYLRKWINEENDDDYGGNGSYNLYISTRNKLRDIFKMF